MATLQLFTDVQTQFWGHISVNTRILRFKTKLFWSEESHDNQSPSSALSGYGKMFWYWPADRGGGGVGRGGGYVEKNQLNHFTLPPIFLMIF